MKDDPVLAQYVYRIAELPKLPPILFESEEEKTLVKKETDFYKALSLWLRNMVLGETLSPEAYQGIGRYYQPYAELWKARLDLVIAVHRSASDLAIKNYSSPAALWYDWLLQQAQKTIEQNGLAGEAVPVSKRGHHNEVSEFCSLLTKQALQPEDLLDLTPLARCVYAEAQVLAKNDFRFRNQSLRPFIRVWRNTAKEIKHCKYLQGFYLHPDVSVFMTGKNHKLPATNSLGEGQEKF
jgi:hypothetical protein